MSLPKSSLVLMIALQFPTNLLDAYFRSFTQQILPLVCERGMGIIGMKSLTSGQILKTEIVPEKAISYAFSLPVDTLVSGIDSLKVLVENLEIIRNWRSFSEGFFTSLPVCP